ncbi:hypothetical protein [Thermoflavimicrobium dichotomicum]|nr:hypothetical protein [Thermoflavimicrobium dichotomicum]
MSAVSLTETSAEKSQMKLHKKYFQLERRKSATKPIGVSGSRWT